MTEDLGEPMWMYRSELTGRFGQPQVCCLATSDKGKHEYSVRWSRDGNYGLLVCNRCTVPSDPEPPCVRCRWARMNGYAWAVQSSGHRLMLMADNGYDGGRIGVEARIVYEDMAQSA